MAAPSLARAKATLLLLWRQRLGMCALRGHARLMLARAHQPRVAWGAWLGALGGGGPCPPLWVRGLRWVSLLLRVRRRGLISGASRA